MKGIIMRNEVEKIRAIKMVFVATRKKKMSKILETLRKEEKRS